MDNHLDLPVVQWVTGYTDPRVFLGQEEFRPLMLEVLAHNASDVFIQPQQPVCARINGRLMAMTKRVIDEREVKAILLAVTGRDTSITDMLEGRPINSRYEVFLSGKTQSGAKIRRGYRVNAVSVLNHGTTSCQIVIRSIPLDPPTWQEVGLNEEILTGVTPKNGIVYIAGSTGSGKTTTIAAVIRHVMEGDTPIKGNIITYEEPIEFQFHSVKSSHSIIVQTQVPEMISNFHAGIREGMRRKPELIFVGELRDQETISSAVEASLTGHAVFATVHATSVPAVMRRLISRFPEGQRATAIFDIVETCRCVLAQRLVRRKDGLLMAAREYLVFDERVRDELLEIEQMGRVTQRVRDLLEQYGHSFKKEAAELLSAGLIDEDVARELSSG